MQEKFGYADFRLIDLISAFNSSFLVFNDVHSIVNFKRNIAIESNKIEIREIIENSKRLVYDIVENGFKFPILYGYKNEQGILTLVKNYEVLLPFLFIYDKFGYDESYKRNYSDKIMIKVLISDSNSNLWIYSNSINNTKETCRKLF